MKRLRQDLESIRLLADMVHRRENIKRRQADALLGVISNILLSHEEHLRAAFDKIRS